MYLVFFLIFLMQVNNPSFLLIIVLKNFSKQSIPSKVKNNYLGVNAEKSNFDPEKIYLRWIFNSYSQLIAFLVPQVNLGQWLLKFFLSVNFNSKLNSIFDFIIFYLDTFLRRHFYYFELTMWVKIRLEGDLLRDHFI